MATQYPNEFLGRCAICLGNAYLSATPCKPGYGVGKPLYKHECPVFKAQQEYDKENQVEDTPDGN